MSLGLADCVCTDKNNVLTVQITFSKEAETTLTSLKPTKLKREYKKLYTIADRIRLLLQPYGILDMDTLYEKYCYYWGNELNMEDLLRVAYWHYRFCYCVRAGVVGGVVGVWGVVGWCGCGGGLGRCVCCLRGVWAWFFLFGFRHYDSC